VKVNFSIKDIDELYILARALKEACAKGGYLPIFMEGELGAGKTTFVRCVVEQMEGGDGAEVSSPSFNIYNVYPTTPEVVHVDLYRCLEPEEEVLAIFEQKDVWVFMEWCDRLDKTLWPRELLHLCIDVNGEGERIFGISGIGRGGDRILSIISKRFRS